MVSLEMEATASDDFSNTVAGSVPQGYSVSANGCIVTVEPGDVGNSVEKFEGKVTELQNTITYKLGDIFKFVDNVN